MLYSRVPRSSAWPSIVKAVLRCSCVEPLRLLVERGARLRRQLGRVGLEEHAVADIDHEVLLAAGRRRAGRIGLRVVGVLVGASRDRQRRGEHGREPRAAQDLPDIDHSGASIRHTLTGAMAVGLTGAFVKRTFRQP